MSVDKKPGPFQKESQTVIRTDEDYTLTNEVDVVEVTAAEAPTTISLPPNPVRGQRHRIVAPISDVTISGNGHDIADGNTNMTAPIAVDFTFSALSDVWVASCQATT